MPNPTQKIIKTKNVEHVKKFCFDISLTNKEIFYILTHEVIFSSRTFEFI